MISGNGQTGQSGKTGAVLVVGAGIGGMQASLDLAQSGFKVYLVEKTSAIGGRMAQLDKTFPTNDCSMCTISPRLIEVGKHPHIEILTNSDVKQVAGGPGSFHVQVLKRPRYVDLAKCNACGDCLAVCPIDVPSEFNQGTATEHAIYKPYPQAIPNAMAISKAERASCVNACPAHINVQGYVALTAKGKFEEANDLIRERNPFPSVCGRVCHHPCEAKCNRGQIDEPVAINNIKRFTADWVRNKRTESGYKVEPALVDPAKPKVAVVGGGPSGLTCARDLILDGYAVTVFESEEKLGGAMRYGIPRYRLPEEMLDYDIQQIIDLGMEVQMGRRLGRDFSIESLKKEGYKAVYLGIGLPQARRIPFPGADQEGVLWGLDFLTDVSLGKNPKVGRRVVVVGGGNVALDAALTARRQGAEEIVVVSLENREEMPAHEWEIQDAIDEGVKLNPSWGPEEILGKNGKVTGIRLVRCTRVFDDSGRFSPEYNTSQLTELTADTIIVAIGQAADLSWIGDGSRVAAERGMLKSDPLTLATNLEGVFAGGDVAYGPKSVVEAIGQGHEAAESIRRLFEGKDLAEGRQHPEPPPAEVPADRPYRHIPRQRASKTLATARGYTYQEIEHTFTEEMVLAEASRCLACGICCECMQCVAACQPKAIDHTQKAETVDLAVGAAVLSAGFDPFDPRLRPEYGYGRYPNVVTSLEFERILSASGPFQGHVLRPSDQQLPKRIAWIQCVGSRDTECGNGYCSSVCCMYATKEAIMAKEHDAEVDAAIFYNDIRAFGKGFERYYERAKWDHGVRYIKSMVSTIKEQPRSHNLLIQYAHEDGSVHEEEFDMVVLSVGLTPSRDAKELSVRFGVEMNEYGFAKTGKFTPNETSRPGVYTCGGFESPMDIPETVMTASSAAALASELLADVRGTMVTPKIYPPERSLDGEKPKVGVFVCHCGTNIARVVDVKNVVEHTKTLENVVHAEDNLYTCSTDTQRHIIEVINELGLNRVVVSSCTPRTHEPLFQDMLREAGLNKYLFEMANIRDQCSWVHADFPDKATEKAKDLTQMAVARATTLEPLMEMPFEVTKKGLIFGGGLAGMTTALSLAAQGFETYLLEKESQLGGRLRDLHSTLEGEDPQAYLQTLLQRIENEPRIKVYTNAEIVDFGGHVGHFRTTVRSNGGQVELDHGVVVVATGGVEYKPSEYLYGQDPRVLTQLEFEKLLGVWADAHAGNGPTGQQVNKRAGRRPVLDPLPRQIVMIQCVGSREDEHLYCSRVCCSEAIKNALHVKELNPDAQVYVLYRDMRTYGFRETAYRKAREAGVLFLRYDPEAMPVVRISGERLEVVAIDPVLGRPVRMNPDYLVLSSAIRAHESSPALSTQLKVPLDSDGFFLEAHLKLRPLDFANEGMFLCGLGHSPKFIEETIAQARGVAARAAGILSKDYLLIGGLVARVAEEKCATCLTCVRTCPYDVPVIREGVAYIEPASCQGCGSCASACPAQAIQVENYKDEQVLAELLAGVFQGDLV